MTPEQFDQLALEVSGVWMLGHRDTRAFTKDQITQFARRLREEWVKGLEPVAWLLEGYDQKIGKPDVSFKQGKHFRIPLYTLDWQGTQQQLAECERQRELEALCKLQHEALEMYYKDFKLAGEALAAYEQFEKGE
jgi:hypothetical protein